MAVNNISIGRISIEYFVINTSFPHAAITDITVMVEITINPSPFLKPAIMPAKAIRVGIVSHSAIDLS